MGIKLIILLMYYLDYLWIPELSVRSYLLGFSSPGVVSDTLTDIFLNPASATKVTQNRFYISHQADMGKYSYSREYREVPYNDYPMTSNLRNVILTNLGIDIYMKMSLPFSIKEFNELPKERAIGMVCARKIRKQSFGLGYLYKYSETDYCHYTGGVPVDSERIHSLSLGMILNGFMNWVITLSKIEGKLYFSGMDKTILNTGIGINGKVNNYFSISYVSLIDTSSHHDIVIFDRVSIPVVNTNTTKIYTIGELDVYYSEPPIAPIVEVATETKIIFNLGIGVEKLLGKFSILGNFSQYIGYSTNTSFVFMSDDPLSLGLSMKAIPLELWVKISPYISNCNYWNIELLYRL